MANLFIGFPVPRAKIADMIAGEAPPLEHKTQHEYDGDDAIDPKNLNSLITLPFPLNGYFLDTYEVEGPGWQGYDSGTGEMFLYQDQREFKTGNTNPSTVGTRLHLAYHITPFTWAKKRHFRITFSTYCDDSATAILRVVTGYPGNYNHFGFQIASGKFSAICGNESSETITDIETYSPGPIDEEIAFHAIFYPGEKVEFYLAGVLTATITTNLPTGTNEADYVIYIALDNNSTTNNLNLAFNHFQVYQEA